MFSINKNLCLSLLALVGCVLSTHANAQSTDGPYSDSYGPVNTDFTHTLVLPKFNTALGTLVEVDLSFNTSFNQSGTITNNQGNAASFTATTDGFFTLSDGVNTLLSTSYSESQSYSNLASGATANYGAFSGSASDSIILTSGFGNFIGPGNIGLDFETLTGQSLTGTNTNNVNFSLTTTASGTATVTYKYNVLVTTPEPGNYALAAGLLSSGAFLALRRRAKRQAREEEIAFRSRV